MNMFLADFLNSVPMTYNFHIINENSDCLSKYSNVIIKSLPLNIVKRPEWIEEFINLYGSYFISDLMFSNNTLSLKIVDKECEIDY